MKSSRSSCPLTLPLALVVLLCSSLASAAKKDADESADFWTIDRVHAMHLTVTAKQWQMMQPTRSRGRQVLVAGAMPAPSTQPSTRPVLATHPAATQPVHREEGERLDPNFYGMQFAYVKARFVCDGVTLNDIGFRERGNSSYNWARDSYKRPFKVNFKHFVEGQKFKGMGEFYLNNNAYDPSFLREALAYETFRELGVPAPRTTFALVYLTIEGRTERQYLGLYTLIEELDSKAFLKQHFGSAKGLTLKPWSIRGFPYLGEQWEAYEEYYNPRSEVTPKAARRTIDFIKLVNYADDPTFEDQIEAYLNVNQFLRWLAGQIILSNLDNILYTGHNFYFYLSPKDNRFYLMPWDMNLAFANYTSVGSAEQLVHLSMMHPHAGDARIIDRLLNIPRYSEMYQKIIKEHLVKHFNPEKLFPKIDALQKVLAQADQAADEAWKARFAPPAPATRPTTAPATNPATRASNVPATLPSTRPVVAAATLPATRLVEIPPRPVIQPMGWRGLPAVELKTFVAERVAALNAQFAGETDGFTPGRRIPTPPPGGLKAPLAFGNLPMLTFAVMRGADGNYDAKLTKPEMVAAIRAFFAEADSTKQGSLDQLHLAIALAKVMPQNQSGRRDFRGGGGGWRGGPRPGFVPDTSPQWAAAIMAAADPQKTGRVTLDQLLAAADQAFDRADQDHSKKLDDEELMLLLDSLAAGK